MRDELATVVALGAGLIGLSWWWGKRQAAQLEFIEPTPRQTSEMPTAGLPATEQIWGWMMEALQVDQPRGIRNNNPGNIRVGTDSWRGAVGDDGAFLIFSAPEYGIRAMARILESYRRRGLVTIRQVISTWAPAIENNTAAYIEHVSQKVGVHPDLALTPAFHWPALIAAIIHHENGRQPYALSMIRDGIALA